MGFLEKFTFEIIDHLEGAGKRLTEKKADFFYVGAFYHETW